METGIIMQSLPDANPSIEAVATAIGYVFQQAAENRMDQGTVIAALHLLGQAASTPVQNTVSGCNFGDKQAGDVL